MKTLRLSLCAALALSSALFVATAAVADELTLIFYPSPGLDWSSPKRLAQTTIRNTAGLSDHAIGHVSIEVKCDSTGAYELVGTTGAEGNESVQLLLREGYGLGILFHTFSGRLTTREEVEDELPRRYRNGKLSYARFAVTAETCERLSTYVAEYRSFGYGGLYGLPNRPLHREGSGCTAFGMSFLELAGLMDPVFERNFSRNLRVPPAWVGGPLTGERVPLRYFYSPLRSSRWAEAHETHFPLHFYDADLMHDWVQKVVSGHGQLPASLPRPTLERTGNAYGVVFDATDVPTPRTPIWKN